MAIYLIDFVENKNPDWKVAQLIADEGKGEKVVDVSINRINKKNEVFPNFDAITPAASVEGELWRSDSGKWYLFAPKPPKASGSGYGGRGASKTEAIEKAQERKEVMIKDAQERKEESIAFFNSTNSALQVLASDPYFKEGTVDVQRKMIVEWRDWFYGEWFKHDAPNEPF